MEASLFAHSRVLITGGAGFIGSALAHRLAHLNAKVTLLDSFLAGGGANARNLFGIEDRVALVRGDLADESTTREIIREQNWIFNLAAHTGHLQSMLEPLLDAHSNLYAQIQFLEACKKWNPKAKIIRTSTRQVYGQPQYLPVDEAHPLAPPDVNAIHMIAGDQLHELYSQKHSLNTITLRLTNTYGPRQRIRDTKQGFVGWFISRAMTNAPIEIYGDGSQTRDFNYVEDVVDALLLAAPHSSTSGSLYNLSGPTASILEVAQTLSSITSSNKIELRPFPDELKKIEIGNFRASSQAFQSLTGWNPKTTVASGLEKTLHYYRENTPYYLGEK